MADLAFSPAFVFLRCRRIFLLFFRDFVSGFAARILVRVPGHANPLLEAPYFHQPGP